MEDDRTARRRSPLRGAGALLLAALAGALALAGFLRLAAFLSPNEPVGHGVFVVEGWMDPDELRRAAELFRRGRYQALVVTGGPVREPPPVPPSYAERAAATMRELGIVEPRLVVLPTSSNALGRTYRSASAVRAWLDSSGLGETAVDLASHGFHAQRSRTLYRLALGGRVEVGVLSVPPDEYDPARWWESHEGWKDLLVEGVGYAWMRCCFRPDPPAEPAGGAPAAGR